MKKYSIKLYSDAGVFKGVLGDTSDFRFIKTINGGLGQLTINLPRKADDYGDIDYLDEIQVWVQDNDSAGVKMYSGFIDEIETEINGNEERATIRALGYVAQFGFSLDIDGTSISLARNSQDPETAVKDVITKYRALYSSPRINYVAGSTSSAGFNISYTSNSKLVIESIERIREMAGSNWWWYVDASNTFYFKSKPSTPTHTFTFGKDINNLRTVKKAGQIINNLVFWNGLQADDTNYISKLYYSGTSQASYWKRYDRLTDGRIKDSSTADKLGDALVESNKLPSVEISFTVKDNNLGDGYDIEDIEPGDTCKIINWKDSDLYSSNLLITKVEYTPEYAVVSVEGSRDITGRALSDIRRTLDTTIYEDGASTLTSSDID